MSRQWSVVALGVLLATTCAATPGFAQLEELFRRLPGVRSAGLGDAKIGAGFGSVSR